MPASVFLKAKKEWTCKGCGEVILSRERYYRKRLTPLCLGCVPRERQERVGVNGSHVRDIRGE